MAEGSPPEPKSWSRCCCTIGMSCFVELFVRYKKNHLEAGTC